jgi:hypothetical protein
MFRVLANICILIVAGGAAAYFMSNRNSRIIIDMTTPLINIKQLLTQPARYDGTVVKVEGRVSGSAGVLGFGVYVLQQEGTADTVLVISHGGIPPTGVAIKVTGKFKQAVSFGIHQYAVIFQDS